MENQYYMIGNRKEIEGGAVFSAGDTDNGYCYKSEQAIKEHKGICYIAESAFECDDTDENGNLVLTIDNVDRLIGLGGVSTWNSARNEVRESVAQLDYFKTYWQDLSLYDIFNKFVDKITECGLDIVDWQCFGTWLAECDLETELDYFLQDEFVQYAKQRLANDNDGTEYSSDEELLKMLTDYLGEDCYKNCARWDSLIDKWEDEPNY